MAERALLDKPAVAPRTTTSSHFAVCVVPLPSANFALMAKRNLQDSRILITGASSGIGRALAKELAKQNARLILNARRADRLAQLQAELKQAGGGDVLIAPGDVTDPDVRRTMIELARSEIGGLDILVNNAGVGAMGRFEDAAPDRVRRIMEVNFFALVETTRLALPLLKQGRQPLVVNISSILGHRGVPRSTEYCASKFAVQGFSEALRAELSTVGIDVLVVSPGTTDTEFFDSLLESRGDTRWPEQPRVSSASVAHKVVAAMRRGRHESIPNRRGQLLVWLNRISPALCD